MKVTQADVECGKATIPLIIAEDLTLGIERRKLISKTCSVKKR